MQNPDNHTLKARPQPTGTLLLLAFVSLVLPYAGLALCVAGGIVIATELAAPTGWLLLLAGAVCFIADVMIDLVWALAAPARSDEPTLNRGGTDLIGRVATVTEAIAGGRGKVHVGDTTWMAEGPDLPSGTSVVIVGSRDVILIVEAIAG